MTAIPSAMVYVLAFKFGLPLQSPVMQWPHPYSTSLWKWKIWEATTSLVYTEVLWFSLQCKWILPHPLLISETYHLAPTQMQLELWNHAKESDVAQSCPTRRDPMDCSLPGSSVHGIFQARVLEWGAISFSRGSSRPRDRTQASLIVDRCFTAWATRPWGFT